MQALFRLPSSVAAAVRAAAADWERGDMGRRPWARAAAPGAGL